MAGGRTGCWTAQTYTCDVPPTHMTPLPPHTHVWRPSTRTRMTPHSPLGLPAEGDQRRFALVGGPLQANEHPANRQGEGAGEWGGGACVAGCDECPPLCLAACRHADAQGEQRARQQHTTIPLPLTLCRRGRRGGRPPPSGGTLLQGRRKSPRGAPRGPPARERRGEGQCKSGGGWSSLPTLDSLPGRRVTRLPALPRCLQSSRAPHARSMLTRPHAPLSTLPPAPPSRPASCPAAPPRRAHRWRWWRQWRRWIFTREIGRQVSRDWQHMSG